VLLIDEACRLAKLRVAADLLDQEVLEDMQAARDRIHTMPLQASVAKAEEEDAEEE